MRRTKAMISLSRASDYKEKRAVYTWNVADMGGL